MKISPERKAELDQYLISIRTKRIRQQRHDTLLAIMLNKNKNDSIIEAIEKVSINSEMKKKKS